MVGEGACDFGERILGRIKLIDRLRGLRYQTFPFIVKNDRVRRQACFQAVLLRSMALSVTTSLRMQAVSASLAGFPARRSRL